MLVPEVVTKTQKVVIDANKNIKLDLDGKTLNSTASEYVIENYGKLEIVDTSDEKTGKIVNSSESVIYNTSVNEENDDTTEKEEIDLSKIKEYSSEGSEDSEDSENKYRFVYDNETKELKSNNQDELKSIAKGYLELNLVDNPGKYTLTIDAEIPSNSGSAYVSITNNPDDSERVNTNNSNYGQILRITKNESQNEPIDIAGGQKYYINLRYDRGSDKKTGVNNEFKIKSITLTKKQVGELTLTGGTIQIDKEGTSSTYYSAIKNDGLLNVKGGKITSSKKYTSGVTTLGGGTSNICGGELELTGDNDRAIWANGNASITNVEDGSIMADIELITSQWMSNINVTGGTFSEECDCQISHNATYGLITLDEITLNSSSKNNDSICIKANYADLIIKDSEISNTKGDVLYNSYDYSNVEIDGTTLGGKIYYTNADNSNTTLNDCQITYNNTCINYGGTNSNIEISGSHITSTGNSYTIICGGNNTNLTIENTSIKNESTNNKYGAMDLTSGGTTYIKGETDIKSVGPAIYADEDKNLELNIISGTVESTGAEAISMGNTTGNINIGTKGDEVNTDNPSIKSAISGWTLDSNRMYLNFYDGKLIGAQDKVIAMSVKELENDHDIVDGEYEGEDKEQREVLVLGNTRDVAKVVNNSEDDVEYDTLKKAVEACKKDAGEQQTTIKLLKNINQTEQIKIEEGQNIKIDLNGYKLYAMTDDTIYNEGKLEITDSTKQVETTDSTEEKENDKNLMCYTGVTVIHNVAKTEESNTDSKSDLTIGDGIGIYCTKSGVSKDYKTVIKNEGKLKTSNVEIEAIGSYIYPIENLEEAEITGGSITTSNRNAYNVYNDTSETLKLKDVNITTDNSTNSYGVYNKKEGTVEIEGTTKISTEGTSIYNYTTGEIIIDNAKIENKSYSTIENIDNGTITINDGEITSNAGSSNPCINNYKNGVININGGTVTSNKTNAISNQSEGTINVVKGTVISNGSSGIYNYKNGTIKLGEKITEEGIEKNEEPSVEDPKITGKVSGVYNNNGELKFYDGIITGPKGKPYSGNVTEKEVGYQVVRNIKEDNTESATLEKVNIIKIKSDGESEKEFSTIAEFEKELDNIDLTKECKITILADFSMSSSEKLTIKENMTAELDINGCAITSAAECTIENNGTLTIKDSKEGSKDNSLGSIKHGVNGTTDSTKCAIKNNSDATLNITSGTVSTTGTRDYGIYNEGKVTISGGTVTTGGSSAYGLYNSGSGQVEITGGVITTSAHAICNYNDNDTIKVSNSNITVNGSNSYGINNDSNGTVEIDEETTITTTGISINNNKEGTITINNGTFKSSRATVIYNESNGKININGGEMTSTSTLNNVFCINNHNGGTINFNDGTVNSKNDGIHNDNYQGKGTINITGGKITSENSYGVNNNKANKTGIINITGGTIKSLSTHGVYNQQGELNIGKKIGEETEKDQDGAPSINEPMIQGTTYGVYSTGTFSFYDGEIIGANGKSINHNITNIEKGYQVVKTTDETGNLETAVLKEIEIFEIGNKSYKTIEEAQEAIKEISDNSQHTIKVVNDTYITGSETITIPEGKDIVLDLNGHKIETSSANAIQNNGKLKIIGKGNNVEGNDVESNKVEGAILGVSKVIIDNKEDLTIEGGTYNSINYDSEEYAKVINNNGEVTWNTGNIILDEGYNYGIYNTEDGSVEWKNGYIEANQSDGKQYGIYTDSINNVNWESGKIFLNTTVVSTQYGIYIKGTGTVDIKAIEFDNIGYSYGANYVKNYSNQYVIYANESDAEADTKVSNIKICDFQRKTQEKSREGHVYGVYGSYANVNIEKGNFTDFDNAINLNNSEINIKDGKYEDSIVVKKDSSLTIDNGNIGTIENHGNITINHGNIKYVTTDGTVTMNQGNINNTGNNDKTKNDGVYITNGTFTLSDGTIESAQAAGVHIVKGNFIMGNKENEVSTETPKVIGSTYGVHKETNGEFEFYDGVITGLNDAINGGVTKRPEEYRVKYETEESDEGITKTIATLEVDAEIDKVVEVNGVFFDKFETAFNHAVNNGTETIVVYSEITISNQMTIKENTNITINLNGHNITANMNNAIFINKGKLTIIDELEDNKEGNEGKEDETSTISKITNSNGCVVINEDTLTIGTKDNKVIKETPVLEGKEEAIQNKGTINWYDGTINGKTTENETVINNEMSILAKAFKANAEKILDEAKEVIQSMVPNPNIKLDKERPVWTNGSVTATIYTTDRIMLDIINDGENVQTTSISVKKIWKMSEEEAKNYRATIQVMKMVDGEKQEVRDIGGNLITVEIIGNDTKDIKDLPVSENGKKIEYVLEEVKVEKRTSEDADDWEEIPVTNFNVTYNE